MVRDAADVVEVTLRHTVSLGIDRVLVVDNGSTDGTTEVLRRLRSELPLSVRSDDGPCRQDLVFTRLAREAAHDGADWVLPIDADELWAVDGDLKEVLARSRAGALSVPVVNFIQRREQRSREPSAVLTMTMRVERERTPDREGVELVQQGRMSLFELAYVPKHVVRAGASVSLVTGNHEVSGIDGRSVKTPAVLCLHAPLRSPQDLALKAKHGARIQERGFEGYDGWHARRWRRLEQEGSLAADWSAHSYADGCLDVYGRRVRLVSDSRLADLARAALPASS
jgi:glycosyltransferase involved in cell wall biosynthesis